MATTFASPLPHTFPSVRPARRHGARYTVDADDALEERLEQSCQLIKQAVLAALPAVSIDGLLLGGGYGRGEGGVRRDTEGEHPYNDLEFYLFVRGNRHVFEHRHGETLRRLGHDLSSAAGIEVELKILTLDTLRRAPISMFFYDMIMGHKWLVGNDDLLHRTDHHRAAHLLPISEATRLLMNRCSGLLFARELLLSHTRGSPPSNALVATLDSGDLCNSSLHGDFIRRNIRKAELAFGDAVLAVFGRYHWSCRERHQRLQKLAASLRWGPELVDAHCRGVEFKLHPFCSDESHAQLASDLDAAIRFAGELWLWLESQRLEHSFISVRHYAMSREPKWPESNGPRNALLNLKLFRRPVLHRAFRHPRERILESLALLLWEPLAFSDSSLRLSLCSNLRRPVGDRTAAVARYRQLWSVVS